MRIDSDFVESVLVADAAASEANFDNVVDMLEWLNRPLCVAPAVDLDAWMQHEPD